MYRINRNKNSSDLRSIFDRKKLLKFALTPRKQFLKIILGKQQIQESFS